MIKKTILKTGIAALNGVYSLMKILPQKKRVVMLSRQADTPSFELRMLNDELTGRGIETELLCDKMRGGAAGAVRYIGPLLRQMYFLATSKAAVLDSYCIPASLFPKRKGLKVVQMWHALGAMKKFGRSILDKPEGRSSAIAELMHMHEGYDYIFTSSEKSRPAFAEAFGYPPEKLTIMSLPRVDVLTDKEADRKNREAIEAAYPCVRERQTILYAPTLRRVGEDMSEPVRRLIDAADTSRFNLIVKLHPLTEASFDGSYPDNVIIDREFSTLEMMSAADYVITDYSAITYDAALKGIPLYFYAFDREDYLRNREFYLDYDKDMPGPVCETAAEVMREIENGCKDANAKKAKDFADLYIEKRHNCTAEIADFIEALL